MGTSRYLCRILVLEKNPAQNGQSPKVAATIHTDKKQFTIGSGKQADICIADAEIDAVHIAIKIDSPRLFIKNLSNGHTAVSTYKLPFERTEPFKSGEAIRLGESNQIIMVELFRKFVEPHDESEAIVREAWEKAKEIESSVADQKQALSLLGKQGKELKAENELEVAKLIQEAERQAEEILKSSQEAKDQVIRAAEQVAQQAAVKAEKEIQRRHSEIDLVVEEKTRKLMEQGRLKVKEIKQEAEQEVEAILASGQREAQLLLENAKSQAFELAEESQREFQNLLIEKSKIHEEIGEYQTKRGTAIEFLAALKADIKKFEDLRQQAHREFAAEKARLDLLCEDLQQKVEVQDSAKRAAESETENFRLQYTKMTEDLAQAQGSAQKELERCQQQSQQATQAKEQAENLAKQIELNIQELQASFTAAQTAYANISKRIGELKDQELKERDQLREKMVEEYNVRRKFEEDWQAKQRLSEQEQVLKEQTAKAQLEGQRLDDQAKKISALIQPLLGLELVAHFGEDQFSKFKPQFEQILLPIVQRCVSEEYDFRRENWQSIRPSSYTKELAQRSRYLKRQFGVTTAALLFFLAAVLVTWANYANFQVSNLSSQAPKSSKDKPEN